VGEILPMLIGPDAGEWLIGERLNPPKAAASSEYDDLLAGVRAVDASLYDGPAFGAAVIRSGQAAKFNGRSRIGPCRSASI
jgi:hypothetical protein